MKNALKSLIGATISMIIKRKKIHLECLDCKTRNYTLTRGENPKRPRLEVKKYCKFCQKHTQHKEAR